MNTRDVFLVVLVLIVTSVGGMTPTAMATDDALGASAHARVRAVKTLALSKDPLAAPMLLAALKDTDPIVRRLAIYGLERLGDVAHVPALVARLGDKDAWVRRTAVVALGKLRSKASVPPLVALLSDDDVYLRHDVFIALGRIGEASAQKPIIEAMGDPRLWAGLALWEKMDIIQQLNRDYVTDRDAIPLLQWLLTYPEWDHPEMADALPEVRAAHLLSIAGRAAEILANKFGDASGEALLLKELSGRDYMMQSAAMALGAITSRAAVAPLAKLAAAGEWITNRRIAIVALGDIGDASAAPSLEKLLADEDLTVRRAAVDALAKIEGTRRQVDLTAPAATIPEIADADLKVPGGKRPPMFICLGVDDNVNLEGIASMLDIAETLDAHGSKAVFTMWVAPLASDWQNRDLVRQKLIYQRLFDMGSEVAHHTLNHNPGGIYWAALPKDQQVKQIDGARQWYRANIDGFTRPFSFKGGGGSYRSKPVDRAFSRALLAKQRFLYRGSRGQHPNEQRWPVADENGYYRIPTGALDGNAPPVHAKITRPIRSDYPGQFDFELDRGVAMMKANFEYHYNHPRRPILAVNAFHDWGFKSMDDSTCNYSHRNEAAILKAFLMDVLVKNKDKYPDTYCVTFRQVIEYVASKGDLEHTLAAGNCQDSRNTVKPLIE